MGSEVFAALKKGLHDAGHNTNVGDEGGFAPNLKSADEALAFITRAVEKAGYRPGEDIFFALDPASSANSSRTANTIWMARARCSMARAWSATMPIWLPAIRLCRWRTAAPRTTGKTWKLLTETLGNKLQIVGDDIFVTNPERLRRGIAEGSANAILIKVNQIGTLSETLETVEIAHRAGWTAVMSHRSGETEDATIADLVVATNGGQIKTGSLARSDRSGEIQPAYPHRGAAWRRCHIRRIDHSAALSHPVQIAPTRFRPRSLPQYSARSARRTTLSASESLSHASVTPMLTVILIRWPS